MNPSEFFNVFENPAKTIGINVEMLAAHVTDRRLSPEEIRNFLQEISATPRFNSIGSDYQVIQNHTGIISQALAQVLDGWLFIPNEGTPEDRLDLIAALREMWESVVGYLSEGVFHGHDVANRVNVLMSYEVYDVADRIKHEAAELVTPLKHFSQLDLPLNTDAFYPLLDLPQGTRVLVVEDQQNVIDLVKYQVGDRGTVVSALTPADLPTKGDFDLILLDWFWGEKIGGDYLDLLKERFPHAIIIGHSSSSNREKYFGETPACNKGAWFDLYMNMRAKKA